MMTEQDKREAAGEPAMFAKYQHESGRTFYRFTPSALQFWLTLLLSLSAFLIGMRTIVFLDLRPVVETWVREDFAPEIGQHKNFATHDEVAIVSRQVDQVARQNAERAQVMAAELLYIRQRVDAIADRVQARK